MTHMVYSMDTVRDRVAYIMMYIPQTRDSDKLLCEIYYAMFEKITVPLTKVETSMESITRCRRKLQEKRPELAATQEVKAHRDMAEEMYRHFAKT